MANPFLARLLDTQQRGLQAERERQMRNDAFGNLGFLGQSLQRSFQPLAEMRQRKALQTQAEQARANLQKQSQENEKQNIMLRDRLEAEALYKPITEQFPVRDEDGVTRFITREILFDKDGRRTTDPSKGRPMTQAQLENIYEGQRETAVNVGRMAAPFQGEVVIDGETYNFTDANRVALTKDIEAKIKAGAAAENQEIDNPYYVSEKVTPSEKPKITIRRFLDKVKKAEKDIDVGAEKELIRARGEETRRQMSIANRYARQKEILNLALDKRRYAEITKPKLYQELLLKKDFAKFANNQELAQKFAELGQKLESGEVTVDGKGLQEFIRENKIQDLNAELDVTNRDAAQKLGLTYEPENGGFFEEVMDPATGKPVSMPVVYEEVKNRLAADRVSKTTEARAKADLKIKKIEQFDPVLQAKYAENAKRLAKAQTEGSAEGRNTVDIANEQRGLIMANLAKGVRSAIKTGKDVDLELIDSLVGNTLPKGVKEQLVEGYKFEKDATNVESLVALANNPLISEADRFAILQQVPQSSGGLQGVKGQDNQPLKYTDFARNEKLLNNLLDEGRILDAPPEEREQLMRDSGYTTPAQQKAVLQIAEKKENERLIKEIERNILNAFEIDPEEVGESVGVLERSTKLDKLWEEQLAGNNGKNKRAIEAAGLTKASFLGSVEKIRRNVRAAEAKIQKDRATALYTLSGKGSSSGAAKQNTYDKIFQKEFGEILRKYDGNITDESFIAEIEDLRVTIYGSKTGGPSDVVGTSSVAPAQPIKDEIESRLNQQENKQTVKQPSPQVNEPVVQQTINQPLVEENKATQGFIPAPSSEVSTPTGALRETAQAEDQNLSKSLLSKAYAGVRQKRIYKRVMDTIGGGDTKRGEIEFLNQALGKTDEEIKQIIEENRPMVKKGRGGQEKLPLNQEDVEVLIKAVRAAERFRKEPETEI